MRLLGCTTGALVGGGISTEPGGICPNAAALVKSSGANTPSKVGRFTIGLQVGNLPHKLEESA
jgi:hypothetical protein